SWKYDKATRTSSESGLAIGSDSINNAWATPDGTLAFFGTDNGVYFNDAANDAKRAYFDNAPLIFPYVSANATSVFFSVEGDKLYRADLATLKIGTNATAQVLSPIGGITMIAASDGAVFGVAANELMRVDATTGATSTIATTPQYIGTQVCADASAVYWT